MSLKLNIWNKGGPPRVYLNGLSISGKAWLENRRGRTGAVFSDVSETMEEPLVFSMAEAVAGCHPSNWEEFVTAVEAGPRRSRGRAPGTMAANRRGGTGPERPLQWTAEWTTENEDKLDLNFKTNPLGVETTLIVDDREPAEMVDRLRTMKNLRLEIASLDTGDFQVADRIVIERKTPVDFAQSIVGKDKRLFMQSERMALSGMRSFLILEGNVYSHTGMELGAITGALSYLAGIQGVSIIPTLSVEHSAYMIAKLVRHTVEGLGYNHALRETKEKDPLRAASFVIEGIPGVSVEIARTLLRTFGSVARVCAASEAELKKVPGVGPTKAKQIHQTLNATVA